MSLDGYLDWSAPNRLLLSNEADFDRVDDVRAASDAILVGAATIRRDNPRLLVRDRERVARRRADGLPAGPLKVTLTASGRLDRDDAFFSRGEAEKLVYTTHRCAEATRTRLGRTATVVSAGASVDLAWVCSDLHARGVRRLMVEGGGSVLTQFLTGGLADELQLVVAPFFVGDSRAPRFVRDGQFPWSPERPATLVEARTIGEVVLMRYALSPRFSDQRRADHAR